MTNVGIGEGRFDSKISAVAPDQAMGPCWQWTAARSAGGYGYYSERMDGDAPVRSRQSVRAACRGREDATRATAPPRERWWVFIPARTVVALVLAVALLNLHLALDNLHHPIVAAVSWVASTVVSVWALIQLWTAEGFKAKLDDKEIPL